MELAWSTALQITCVCSCGCTLYDHLSNLAFTINFFILLCNNAKSEQGEWGNSNRNEGSWRKIWFMNSWKKGKFWLNLTFSPSQSITLLIVYSPANCMSSITKQTKESLSEISVSLSRVIIKEHF